MNVNFGKTLTRLPKLVKFVVTVNKASVQEYVEPYLVDTKTGDILTGVHDQNVDNGAVRMTQHRRRAI